MPSPLEDGIPLADIDPRVFACFIVTLAKAIAVLLEPPDTRRMFLEYMRTLPTPEMLEALGTEESIQLERLFDGLEEGVSQIESIPAQN